MNDALERISNYIKKYDSSIYGNEMVDIRTKNISELKDYLTKYNSVSWNEIYDVYTFNNCINTVNSTVPLVFDFSKIIYKDDELYNFFRNLNLRRDTISNINAMLIFVVDESVEKVYNYYCNSLTDYCQSFFTYDDEEPIKE